ncbi:MAG: SH3 domain-containing protein [Clostridia bacterium]|nr:SH3 domain-containing protein [Clostridia bacterium]
MITKKKLMVIFTIILSMIMVSKVLGANITTYAPKYAITTSNVNLRSGASTSSTIFQTIKKGTNVKIIGELGDFYAVQTPNNNVGFLSKNYVKMTGKITIGSTFYSLTPSSYETKANSIVRKRSFYFLC